MSMSTGNPVDINVLIQGYLYEYLVIRLENKPSAKWL